MSQLDFRYFSLNEFDNLVEATKLVKGIVEKVDNNR